MKKKIISFLFIYYLTFALRSFGEEYKYVLLSPAELYGIKNYSSFYWNGTEEGFRKYCFNEAFNALKKYYGNNVEEILTVSSDIKKEEELKNNIYVRINISRMQLSYELIGKENFLYALRTTGGIEFLNIKTGEVYFSKIYTIIQPKQIIKKKNDPLSDNHKKEFYDLFKNNVRELFDYLFSKAKIEYKPGIVKANIVKKVLDFSKNKTGILEAKFAINKGRYQGVVERQQYRFSNLKGVPPDTRIRVLEIQDNYSIVSITSSKEFNIDVGTEIFRSGGVEVSSKYSVRMMVSNTEILDNTQIDNRYNVDPGFITQIIHDNLSDNSQFQMLPYGSIAEQQLQSTKVGEKEEEVIGNRQKPDIYVKCVISSAQVYSTSYEGGEYLKLVVKPVLIFYDANLGNVLYTTSYEESSLQVIKVGDREANITEQFEILTKNAIYEITKKAKSEFKISQISGMVNSFSNNEIDLKIESGKLSEGLIFRAYKKGEMLIDPVTKNNLGYLLTYAGNVKVKSVSGLNAKASILFVNQDLSQGDILKANSDNIFRSSIIIQPDEVKIVNDKGNVYEKISQRAGILTTLLSLNESGKFVVLLPNSDLSNMMKEKDFLEPAGHFKSEEKMISMLEPQVKVNTEIIAFPSEIKSDDEVKVNVGLRFIAYDVKTKKEFFRKGQKQTLPIKGKKNKDEVTVGLEEKDHSKYYLSMCYNMGLNLSNLLFEEAQKIFR